MTPEIVVIVGSIAFGMMILLARPRSGWLDAVRGVLARLVPASRSVGLALRDLARPWPVAILGYGLLLVVLWSDDRARADGLPGVALAFGLVALFFACWIREFVRLMALRDDELPGRFDKPIWAALLILIPPVGLVAFRCSRAATAPEPRYDPRAKPAADYARDLA